MKKWTVLFCLVLFVLSVAIAFAQNQGQEKLVLNGGKQGNITLPHHLHQGIANDCMVCHADFSKEPGALQAAKDKGALKRKQVMNGTCISCHRDRKNAGKSYGPVSCSGCHKK